VNPTANFDPPQFKDSYMTVHRNGPCKQMKLKLFGHMEDRRLVKTVMMGMIDEDRPRGRPTR